jgi:hypothetical protein
MNEPRSGIELEIMTMGLLLVLTDRVAMGTDNVPTKPGEKLET